MKLFGKEILLADRLCMHPHQNLVMNGYPTLLNQPYVNLFVKITDDCNAHCPFCCNDKVRAHTPLSFDVNKLFQVIDEIVNNGYKLNRISLTGGEPSLYPEVVIEILQRIDESDACAFTQVQLNTNGLTSDSINIMHHPRFDCISLSLHHYDRGKLSELYGHKVNSNPLCEIKGISNKLNISCNLIIGYIDSAKEIEKMIHHAQVNGVKTIGFVSLMHKNRYCENRFVDFRGIDLSSIPSLLLSNERALLNICGCKNYLFLSKESTVEVYFRINENPMFCGSSLIFDGEYLRQGFDNDNIIF